MPKIFGTNILLILLAGFLFFMLGWVWYGMLFSEQWMALAGVTAEASEANMGRAMVVGIIISILQATGIAGIMSMMSNNSLIAGLKVGLLSWLFFALPILAYDWNYAGTPIELLQIDASHLLIGYLLMGAVFGLLRKTD